jgi:hypothetical protein
MHAGRPVPHGAQAVQMTGSTVFSVTSVSEPIAVRLLLT